MLKSYLKQDDIDLNLPPPGPPSIRLQHKISFGASFTFSKGGITEQFLSDLRQYITLLVLVNKRWNLAANQQKWGWGVANQAQNFNAGFVKPTPYNIFSFILLKVFN